MASFLIITADRGRGGRGVRGHVLAWFLRTFVGRSNISVESPDDVRGGSRRIRDASHIFIGFPNSFTADELQRLGENARRIVAFDYLDQQELAWTAEHREALGYHATLYLKPWKEADHDHGVRVGLLPLRTDRRFAAVLRLQRARLQLFGRPQAKYDVLFLGRPNQTRIWRGDQVVKLDQRVRWLMELKRESHDINFFGGLTQLDGDEYADQEARYGDLSDLRFKQDRVSFLQYCRLLWQSRLLLAPGGNVPWTYRHYEAIYAGASVLANDFRRRELLVPLPPGVIQVGDDEPVLPAVRRALAMSDRERAEIAEANFTYLEQFLRYGAYSRSRSETFERFMAQLEKYG